MKERNLDVRSPLQQLQLGTDLVRIEPLRRGESQFRWSIECLPVEGRSAVSLAEDCVD